MQTIQREREIAGGILGKNRFPFWSGSYRVSNKNRRAFCCFFVFRLATALLIVPFSGLFRCRSEETLGICTAPSSVSVCWIPLSVKFIAVFLFQLKTLKSIFLEVPAIVLGIFKTIAVLSLFCPFTNKVTLLLSLRNLFFHLFEQFPESHSNVRFVM